MAAVKRGLGKGLDGLIPDKNNSSIKKNTTTSSKSEKSKKVQTTSGKTNTKNKTNEQKNSDNNGILKVNISLVQPNLNQPRKNFDEDALNDLAESIKEFGIISPLIVKEINGIYEIIAGERRWRAAKIADLKEVPVIINNEYNEQQTLEVSIIENIQREKLNAIEEAQAYKRLIEEFKLKQDEVAERVSKSRTEITNKLRLLKLDARVQKMLIDEMITMGHARALLGFENGDDQYETALKVFDEKLSVRDIEKLVKSATKDEKKKVKEVDEQYNIICQEASRKMSESMGTKVNINQKNKGSKGKIEIEFYSQDELDRIMNLILSCNG